MSLNISTRVLGQGIARIFSLRVPLSTPGRLIAGVSVATLGGVVLSRHTKLFKMPDAFPSLKWHTFQIYPRLHSLSSKKVVLGGVVLAASVLIIYTLYTCMAPLLNSPFPKALTMRVRQNSNNSMVVLIGAGALLGTRYLISAFKIDVHFCPFRSWVSKPQNQLVPVASPAASLSEAPSETCAALPSDILGQYIFPLVIDRWYGLRSFVCLGQVCLTWRGALLHEDCLTSSRYERHFL